MAGLECGKVAFETAKSAFEPIVTGLKNLHWENLPATVVEHVVANPGLTAFQIICILITLVPGLCWAPAVAGLGVVGAGPVSGSFFAALQSVIGTPAAMSVVQSAGMGGAWGISILNGVTQTVAIGVGAATESFKTRDTSAPKL